MLATFLVFGIGIHRSAGCPRSAQAQRIKEVLFGLEIKRAGSSFFSDKAEQRLMGNCRINQIASSIAPKVLRKSTVGILQEALAKLRGPLIASSSSAVLFRELGVREFKERTISCWLRGITSYKKCPEKVNRR